ncbi:hypothetical protein NP233_g2025 [Leucocoprinus birnbaumii]|uniref:AB hydrolase-1 domain-containing protein n=1 Tax=Leucocoprinus birnbaumii TaxID=56174 RepID=A0AAD5W1I0_9AGAR|nr:hypothetical protein NP233_g2025 [Leucocoprinus birnbaumii]
MNTVTDNPHQIPAMEGRMSWNVPGAGKQCETWFRVFGDLKSEMRPLVILHGGPGVTSDYLTLFSDLTQKRFIPVVVYDQLGNGQHLDIYHDYDILGHSWGGMLGARHAVRQPGGLKRLVLMSAPASNKLWIDAQEVLRRKLPQSTQDVLDRCERAGKMESPEYQEAVQVYYAHYFCTLNPMPDALMESFGWLEKDPTVYFTMNGPSEFYITGPNKDWTIVDEAHKILVPTLLTNGWRDMAADSCVYPFFNLIPRVRWVQFADSSHMAHLEERQKYMEVVGQFLQE